VARYFTADYVERAVLRDGSVVRLRLVAPDDRHLLRTSFDRWSPQSRYARFLAPKDSLSDDELTYLCDLDQETHFALGAVLEAGDGAGEPIGAGIARFIRLPFQLGEPSTAEAAIAVTDELQGKGLGKLLLLRLCAAAAERDIEQFRCEVLADNTSMRALIATIAPEHTIVNANGVATIDFAIGAIPPDASPATTRVGPLYAMLRAAAENVVDWTDAVRRLWRR
jgi:RimJ/RimL family protein N-acetyltransferase